MLTFSQCAAVLLSFAVASFIYNKKSLIVLLICLEILVFLLLLVIVIHTSYFTLRVFFLAFFLCFAARRAATGLTLLVRLRRVYGNDRVSNLW